MDLRLTRRAIEDLGLRAEDCPYRSAQGLDDRHPVIEVLAERLQNESEPPGHAFYLELVRFQMLHHGMWCALLWYERSPDTLWLCAVRQHRQDQAEPAHEAFLASHRDHDLRPTQDDVRSCELPLSVVQAFVEALHQFGGDQVDNPVDIAFRSPGEELTIELDILDVVLLAHPVSRRRNELWMAIYQGKRQQGAVLSPRLLNAVFASLLRQAGRHQLHVGSSSPIRPRDRAPLATLCWRPWERDV